MCGIVGYVGNRIATPLLIDGLKRLEYRGYDSAGVAIMNGKGVETRKAAGKIARLESVIDKDPPQGTLGIGHTRWATHGPPTTLNAHPHVSTDRSIAVVHNGIIENATALKAGLEARGFIFTSDTDTEVLAHLIEAAYAGNLEAAVIEALRQVEGTYGIAVISSKEKDKIVAARKGSPLLVGLGEGEYYIASDASAILSHTRNVVYLDDGDVAVITRDGYKILDLEAAPRDVPVSRIEWDLDQIERSGYPHFMLKEIFEQPTTVENTMRGRLILEEGFSKLGGLNISKEDLLKVDNIIITACGTSWHSALIGEMMIEELCRIPVEVEYASEFRYRNPIVTPTTLCIVISQSGETADTLGSFREAKARGARGLAICNVVGSAIARESDDVLYTHAGPEIGVASTKAFTTQLAAFFLLAVRLGRLRGTLSAEVARKHLEHLRELPGLVEKVLKYEDVIKAAAYKFSHARDLLFLGRGPQYPVALEGALKLKEISYIHAEGYAAGEMKHGPIALIDENMPVMVLAVRDSATEAGVNYEKILGNLQEVKARGGRVIAIHSEGDTQVPKLAEASIPVPQTNPLLMPIISVIPTQLFSYHVADHRGTDVDQPRNLAKSVTVE